MLNELAINNFQSHKQTNLIFSPGVNVIIGESDSGKTAILRSLNWLLWNRPLGNSFCSYWGGPTFVKAKLSDGPLIIRKRTKDFNGYQLKAGKVSQKFEAIKTDVPEEISKILNITPVNIQQQLDSPFLLSNSPGEVAQHFNTMAHLDAIDLSTKKIMEEKRSLDWKIKLNQEEQEKKIEQLQQYENLTQLEIRVEELEQEQGMQKQIYNKIKSVTTLIQDIEKIEEKIEKYQYVALSKKLIQDMEEAFSCNKRILDNQKKLNNVIQDITKKEKQSKTLKKILNTKDQVNALEKHIKDHQENKQLFASLSSLVASIKREEKKIDQNKETYTTLKNEYKKRFPDVCPLCGQFVSKSFKEE